MRLARWTPVYVLLLALRRWWLLFASLAAFLEALSLRLSGVDHNGSLPGPAGGKAASTILIATPTAGVLAAWPQPGGFMLSWWLHQLVVLLHILFSPRFNRVVRQLWIRAHRRILSFYLTMSVARAAFHFADPAAAVWRHSVVATKHGLTRPCPCAVGMPTSSWPAPFSCAPSRRYCRDLRLR